MLLHSRDLTRWEANPKAVCDGASCRLHVSGSAFKIVQARAYHHGTMLIDAKLQDLKGVLSNKKVRVPAPHAAAVGLW